MGLFISKEIKKGGLLRLSFAHKPEQCQYAWVPPRQDTALQSTWTRGNAWAVELRSATQAKHTHTQAVSTAATLI
jgi:hypothetical protein